MMLKNITLLLCSILISLVFLEMGLSALGFPINNKVSDPILGHTVSPHLVGIDSNGFRNPKVLHQADIVTLGDSHTYGENAISANSWPQRLGTLAQKQVYNFGVGGYGSLQYYYLFDQALKLNPELIVIGLLFQNDLSDVLELVSRQQYWQDWSRANKPELLAALAQSKDAKKYQKKRSSWLKSTAISYLYQDIIRPKVIRKIFPKKVTGLAIKEVKNTKFMKLKRIKAIRNYLDLNKADIAQAYGLTKDLLSEMAMKSNQHNTRLCVLLIPSMESVFYQYLVNKDYQLPQDYHQLVKNEQYIMADIATFFEKNNIEYVTILDEMRHALEQEGGLYTTDHDGHPYAKGYSIYAQKIYKKLYENN